MQSHSELQPLNYRVDDQPSQHVTFGYLTAKRMIAVSHVPVGVLVTVTVVQRDIAMHQQKRFVWKPHLNLSPPQELSAKCSLCLQNALKIFKKMPSALMDIVRGTDPTTVTQHGLYMRPLTDPSLHPLLALKPLDKPPEQPAPPGTPPHEEKERSTSAAASGQISSGQVNSSESGSAAAVCQPPPEVNPEAAKAVEEPSSALTAGRALTKAANALSLNSSTADDKATNSDENNPHGNPPKNTPSGPALTPQAVEGSSQTSKGSSSSPTGAALGAISKPEGKADGEPAAPEGSFPASEGHPVGTGFTPQGGDPSTQPVGVNSDPSHLWGRGRVTLLGDAAHATIPNGNSLNPGFCVYAQACSMCSCSAPAQVSSGVLEHCDCASCQTRATFCTPLQIVPVSLDIVNEP